ncbi:hypothetical protein BUY79_02340 [Staphylococcus equorum]|nr:hypothetical protein BUY79_02340 [Staphylococcus equorum]
MKSSNTLDATFMKISELQKLDVLLKRDNDDSRSKNVKIIFGMNGRTLSGDFIPNVKRVSNSSEYKIHFKDLTTYEDDIDYSIGLTNLEDWSALSTKKNGQFYSKIETLILKSNKLNSHELYFLLNNTINGISIDFESDLQPYIYNVKSLTNQLPINFMKVDEDTVFDFVSLAPENTI